MKKFLLALSAIGTLATPALATQTVYLKDGGTISAKSAWQTKGKVHVLVNRDTLTEFSTAEIDLKRTFARKKRVPRKHAALAGPSQAAAGGAVLPQKPTVSKPELQLPSLPKLPEKNLQNLAPKGEEGTIRKHKKEMSERIGE